MKAVLCLSGAIASGKTTVAYALASALPGAVVRSFGEVVRRRAGADGLPLDRGSLQATGMALIAEGWPAFVAELLHDIPASAEVLIVDGVRHAAPIEQLRRRFDEATVRTVYLSVEEAVLKHRLRNHGEQAQALQHAAESSLHEVAVRADLIIDGTQPIPAIVAAIKALV